MRTTFEDDSIDDLMRNCLTALISDGERVTPTKGPTLELFGCVLKLTNPRSRLSRSVSRGRVFSALGELLWYLSGTKDVQPIEYYIADYRRYAEADGTVHGAYGPRLFNFDGIDQVAAVIETLRSKPHSRQAVIQLFDRHDVQGAFGDVPCTCCMQFLLRNGSLQMITYMRSNDAYKGLPHDIFAFTMLQEIVARSIDTQVGSYTHMVGSLHLYETDRDDAQRFLDEGWQSTEPVMPSIPDGDPWPPIYALLEIEEGLRLGSLATAREIDFDAPLWSDLACLLEAYAQRKNANNLEKIISRVHYDAFKPYIRERIDGLQIAPQAVHKSNESS